MKKKKILFFSDLEGTILREYDGDFSEEDFYKLLTNLQQLSEITNSLVEIRLVSPIGFKRMNEIVDKMESVMVRHGILNESRENVRLIEAAASPFDINDDVYFKQTLSRKIIPLPKVYSINDLSREEKKKYTQTVFEYETNPEDVSMIIYAGNGRNDLLAMQAIKRLKKSFLICPKNSRREVKEISDYVSDKTDIKGITDGIDQIIYALRRRKQKADENKSDDFDFFDR